jgi:hypothetical protein
MAQRASGVEIRSAGDIVTVSEGPFAQPIR